MVRASLRAAAQGAVFFFTAACAAQPTGAASPSPSSFADRLIQCHDRPELLGLGPSSCAMAMPLCIPSAAGADAQAVDMSRRVRLSLKVSAAPVGNKELLSKD